MMRATSFRNFLVTAMLSGMAVAAYGQNGVEAPESPGGFRIGVVDLKLVFDSYQKQKDQYAQLERERDERQKVIDQLSDRITKAKERYEANKEKMSKEELRALETAIETDYAEYQGKFKQLQQEIDLREKNILESIFEDIREAVRTVGAQQNYHLILEGGESGRSGVLYSSTTLNMTQRVVEFLNSTYKKG